MVSLASNWLGDSLDGTLARFRNCQRPRYGYYVDHVIDLFGVSALMAGLACSGYMNPLIAVSLLAAFALVEAEVFLATYVHRIFRLSCFRIGPTELRIVLAVGTLYLLHNPWVHIGHRRLLLFDVGGIISIAGLICAFVYSSLRNTRALYLAEPVTSHRPSSEDVSPESVSKLGPGPAEFTFSRRSTGCSEPRASASGSQSDPTKTYGDPLPHGRGSEHCSFTPDSDTDIDSTYGFETVSPDPSDPRFTHIRGTALESSPHAKRIV